MSILFSKEIFTAVIQELKNASESVQIITAYCKEDSLKRLTEYINEDVMEKRLMIRFRLDDIIRGSTDFDILEYCLVNGWQVYIRFDLHAKTYIVDNKRAIIGSANTTRSGFGNGKRGNMEMGTLVAVEEQDLEKINRLYRDAILVNNEILFNLRKQYKSIEIDSSFNNITWDSSITSLFKPHIDALFSYELPDTKEIIPDVYISFLDEQFNGNIDAFKAAFRWSNAYLWLLSTLEENGGCLYFGALTEKLHNALVTDPKPYRKDVKILLSNLLSIVETVNMEEIKIDRPNFSQRVMLRK